MSDTIPFTPNFGSITGSKAPFSMVRTTVAAEGLYAMLDGAGLFDRASMHLLLAKDGYEAMSLCRTREVDLVILQQTMGGVSGISVCRALKQVERAHRASSMVLDQGERPATGATAEAAGADPGMLVVPARAARLGQSRSAGPRCRRA